MAKRKVPKTAFKKGNPGGPGRPPKTAELSELQRLKDFARKFNLPDAILQRIAKQAVDGKEWALRWWADRLWPEAFVAQKLNEDEGAESTSETLLKLREFLKPNGS